MHNHLTHLVIPFLLLLSLLAGCTPAHRSGHKLPDLSITPTTPIIAYHKDQISPVIAGSPWESVQKVGECSSSNIPLWTTNRTLNNYRPNRAVAVGFPYDCGGSWHSWSYNSEASAAAAALNRCLDYMTGLEKHTGRRCGARLILVNQRLLVTPEELPAKSRVPFIMELREVTGERFSIYGMFQYEGPGQNRRLDVFSDKGDNVCSGEYSLSYIQALFGSGDFSMNCFDGKLSAKGTLSVKRINPRHMPGESTIGIGKGRSSVGQEFRFVTGITIDQYETYKDLLQ